MPITKFLNDKSGATAVVFGVSIGVVIASAAIAVSFTEALNTRSKTQQALDAAVLAGVTLPFGTSDDDRIATAAKMYYANGTIRANGTPEIGVENATPATFTVSNEIVYGDIQFDMKSPVLAFIGRETIAMQVSSAARKREGEPACVLGLDPTEDATMDFNGHASLIVDNCATQANSVSGKGLNQVGQPILKAKEIGISGGYKGTGYSPSPISGTTPIPDPYASLPYPPLEACHPMSGRKLQQTTTTLTPGTYCGGLSIMAKSEIFLEAGIYIMKDGPLNIQADGRVRGERVMISFQGESATLYMLGNAELEVTSPTSGTYANIQFFGDREVYGKKQDNVWFTVIGGSKLKYDGVLYAPSYHVWFAGQSEIEGKSPSYIAVAKKLWFQDKTKVHLAQKNTRSLDVEAAMRLRYGAALMR